MIGVESRLTFGSSAAVSEVVSAFWNKKKNMMNIIFPHPSIMYCEWTKWIYESKCKK